MEKLIEILPNIYGVKTPIELNNFGILQYPIAGNYIYDLDSKELNCWKKQIPRDNYKIIGTITEAEINFNTSDLVNSTEIDVEQYDGIFVATPRFWDYETESFDCQTSDESFRSALPKDLKIEKLLILQKL